MVLMPAFLLGLNWNPVVLDTFELRGLENPSTVLLVFQWTSLTTVYADLVSFMRDVCSYGEVTYESG